MPQSPDVSDVPIIILTAKDDISDKVTGLTRAQTTT